MSEVVEIEISVLEVAMVSVDDDLYSDGEAASAPLPPKQRKKRKTSQKPKLVGSGNEPPPTAQMAKMSFGDRMLHGGGLAGLGMMIGAAVWFVVGLMGGVIFFYPPVLFILGFFTFLKGVFGDN